MAGFVDDAPDRARLKAAFEHGLLSAIGRLPLLEVLEADHDQLYQLLSDASGDDDDGATRECLHLILEDAAEDLRVGVFAVSAPAREARSGG